MKTPLKATLSWVENVSGNIKASKWIQFFQIKIQTKFSHLYTLPAKMIKISLMVYSYWNIYSKLPGVILCMLWNSPEGFLTENSRGAKDRIRHGIADQVNFLVNRMFTTHLHKWTS